VERDDTHPAPEGHGDPPVLPNAGDSFHALPDRPQAFFSSLLTEHFVLESARGITVAESSSRASLYLMTLSSSLVAYGFLAQTPIALNFLAVVIPVVVVLGLFTYERLVQTSLEDVAALDSMQRIRRYYARILPGAEDFFSMPHGQHALNELLDIGGRGSWRGVFFTMSTAIATVNSIVAGAGVALLSYTTLGNETAAILLGAALGALFLAAQAGYQVRRYQKVIRIILAGHRPRT
jgi:hypothetical protein